MNVSPLQAGCSEVEFQQFVVTHIVKLLSGQEKIERLLSVPLNQEKIECLLAIPSNQDLCRGTIASNSSYVDCIRSAELEAETEGPHERKNSHTSEPADEAKGLDEREEPHEASASVETTIMKSRSGAKNGKNHGSLVQLWWEPQDQTPMIELQSSMTAVVSELSTQTSSSRKWPVTLKPGWPRSLQPRNQRERESDSNESEVEHSMVAARCTMAMSVAGTRLTNRISRQLSRNSLTIADYKYINVCAMQTLTLTPYHPLRMVFDVISMIFLCYDLITIPLFLAWDIETHGLLRTIQCAVVFYWTIDMFASFFTGYIYDGEVVTDFKKVALRYLKGSFAIDFAVLMVDWLSLLELFLSGATAKAIRMSKVGRLFRLVDVLRMAKIADAFHRIADRQNAKSVALGFDIFKMLKLLLLIVYINHIMGCIWFATAKYAHSDTGAHWTDLLIAGGGARYEETTNFFQYTTALHWSLTQMTPGSMQINAQNTSERIFNICCLVFGVLFFSSLISTLSAKLTEVTMSTHRKTEQINIMGKFFRERQVDGSLVLIVKQQVRQRMNARKPLLIQNVEAFRFVSERLLHELHLSISRPFLRDHSLFVVILRLDKEHAKELCYHAVSFMALNRDDILFSAGGDCNEASIITEGFVLYTQKPDTSWLDETLTCPVNAGTWLCEAALWSEWTHLGTSECVQVAEILKINADQLMKTAKKHLLVKRLILDFGKAYHNRIVSVPRRALLNDLCHTAIQSSQLIAATRQDVKTIVNTVSIEILAETRFWFSSAKWQRLYHECLDGQTILVPISERNVHRCVDVSCLRLIRRDLSILAMVGVFDESENKIVPDVKLPGTKLMFDEDPEAALARMLVEDLGVLKSIILLTNCEDTHEVQKSFKYSVPTTYNKHIFEAKLDVASDLPSWLMDSQPIMAGKRLPAKTSERNFLVSENGKRVQVYAWITPHLFEQITSGAGDIDVGFLLQGFDRTHAVELELEVCPQQSAAESDSDEGMETFPHPLPFPLPLKPRLTAEMPKASVQKDCE